jgi:formylmethanofuran--tetrahydromethanopterin N-formyltransferase
MRADEPRVCLLRRPRRREETEARLIAPLLRRRLADVESHRRTALLAHSKYKGQIASTNDAYCPTLKAAVNTALSPDIEAVMEIVIDGLSAPAIAAAMRAGIHAVAKGGAREGITHITAGNYGGNLGPHHFHLKEIIG